MTNDTYEEKVGWRRKIIIYYMFISIIVLKWYIIIIYYDYYKPYELQYCVFNRAIWIKPNNVILINKTYHLPSIDTRIMKLYNKSYLKKISEIKSLIYFTLIYFIEQRLENVEFWPTLYGLYNNTVQYLI